MNKAGWSWALILAFGAALQAEFPIVTAPGDQQNPAMYGSIIVWQDFRSGNWDIYGYDIQTDTEFIICEDPANQTEPDIYQNYVVWRDSRDGQVDIWLYDLDAEEEFQVTTAANAQEQPAIHEYNGKIYIVWTDSRNAASGKDIYGYNWTNKSEVVITTADREQSYPDIYSNYVVWQDYQNQPSGKSWDIYGRNLSSGSPFAVYSETGTQQYPAIYGSIVVWQEQKTTTPFDWDIRGKNLSNGQVFDVVTSEGNQRQPAIYGDWIVWEDTRGADSDIYLYRLSTQEEFPVSTMSADQTLPAVSGGAMAWQDRRAGNDDVYGFQPVANAEVETATEVGEGTTSGTTDGAHGTDVTEDGYRDFRDVWFLFTADQTASYIISLCDSSFDTTLAVFDQMLMEVEFNEDYCGLQSQLILKGIAGKTYYIRIAGYDGAMGDFEMEIVRASDAGAALTKLPDSSYYQGVVPYAFFLYPEPTPQNPDSDPERILSGQIEFAVYDTLDFPAETPGVTVPGTGRYIYAYQLFNGSENFLGLPQEPLNLFLMQSPAPFNADISSVEDPPVIVYPDQTILWPGIAPTDQQQAWGTSYWQFDNTIGPGQWSWYLFLRSDSDYEMVDYFRINASIKSGSLGLPVPADWSRNIADFMEDGFVDYRDFAAWAQEFLAASSGIPLHTDFNGDGKTDLTDLQIFVDNWMWQGL